MIMMAKPMKAQTESTDPVLNNTDCISKFKKIKLMRQIQTSNPNLIIFVKYRCIYIKCKV